MRGNLWSRTPANRARPNRVCAWPEAPTGGGVPVESVGRVQMRDAGVLAGHGGITAVRRRPVRCRSVLARGTVKSRSTSVVSELVGSRRLPAGRAATEPGPDARHRPYAVQVVPHGPGLPPRTPGRHFGPFA